MPDPQPNGGFEWVQAPWGPVLRCGALRPFADHFFTAASLTLGDDPDEWTAVAALASVPFERLRLLTQVHGRTIASSPAGALWSRPQADGVTTDDPSVALVVRVADCAPILLADRRLGVAAAVHAGWRSTMQRIVPAAIDALHGSYGTDPSDLLAAVGPSLGVCCGEMGDEVLDAFRAAGHDAATLDRWFVRTPGKRSHFDLWRANREQLEASGVPASAIHVAGLCTRTYAGTFHSYRAAGPAAGRMAAVIRANPERHHPV